jgi:pimeloyl-ACP methyl ester carboxylesterase
VALQLAATAELNLQEELARVRQPLLLLHGSEDSVIPDRNALLFTMRLKDVRLVRLSGLGHMFWVEDLALTAAYCRTFLQTPAPAL